MVEQILNGSTLICIGTSIHTFTIWTPHLAATLQLADTGSLPVSTPVKEGTNALFSGTLAGDQTLRFGPVSFRGAIHPKLWFLGSLGIVTTPVLIPTGSPGPISVQTPFTLTGTLSGFTQNPTIGNPGPSVFDLKLQGKGTAIVGLGTPLGPPGAMLRSVQSLVYSFIT